MARAGEGPEEVEGRWPHHLLPALQPPCDALLAEDVPTLAGQGEVVPPPSQFQQPLATEVTDVSGSLLVPSIAVVVAVGAAGATAGVDAVAAASRLRRSAK